MGDEPAASCPACGTRIAGAATCHTCGLVIGGSEDRDLRALQASVASIDSRLRALEVQKRELIGELERMIWTRRREMSPPADVAAPSLFRSSMPETRHELDTEQVRNVLLGLGTTLLALAALAFTAVAWTQFGDGGRAVLLAGATGLAVGLSVIVRPRLRATSEALTGLAILLALIDWFALRRAGVGAGLSLPTWWAAGAFVV